jgi:hypothetical protein
VIAARGTPRRVTRRRDEHPPIETGRASGSLSTCNITGEQSLSSRRISPSTPRRRGCDDLFLLTETAKGPKSVNLAHRPRVLRRKYLLAKGRREVVRSSHQNRRSISFVLS